MSALVWITDAREWGLTRKSIQDELANAFLPAPITRDLDGKPLLGSGSGSGVSLAHAGTLIALAYNPNGPVGVDLEALERRLAFGPGNENLLEAAFTERENERLGSLPSELRWREILRLWTIKEAGAKLWGAEQFDDPTELEAMPGSPWVADVCGEAAGRYARVEVRELRVSGVPFLLAVASECLGHGADDMRVSGGSGERTVAYPRQQKLPLEIQEIVRDGHVEVRVVSPARKPGDARAQVEGRFPDLRVEAERGILRGASVLAGVRGNRRVD
jgi:hypothetical protein